MSGPAPKTETKASGPLRFLAVKTDWGAYKGIEEAGKMGMIAFYAGLFVGILFGFLLLSLLAFYLVEIKVEALSRPSRGIFSEQISWSLEPGVSTLAKA